MVTAAVYARISLDRQDGEGVARQLADARALAEERGWEVVEYVDNSLSAFHNRRRPEWERLLTDLRSGTVQAVVAYHPDRLYRKLSDLEDFIDAAANAEVLTVKAGEVDVSTASGRMVARLLGAVARHESERIGERVARAKKERAAQGRAAGGGRRAFGLTGDRKGLVVEEAAQLRQVAANLRGGSSWTREVDRLNEAGVTTTMGRQWTVGNLRRTLTAPYVAGLRSYHGEIVGDAAWPAILDRDVWDELRAAAAGRARGRPPSDRHLLTGLLTCGRCGFTLYGNLNAGTRVYRCPPAATTSGRGCAGVSIVADPVDRHVIETVGAWLTDDETAATLANYLTYGAEHDAALAAERIEVERRRKRLTAAFAAGDLDDGEYDAARAVLTRRLAELAARLQGSTPSLGVSVAELAMAWERGTITEKREVIRLVARTPIVVAPSRKGARLDLGRIGLLPVWAA